LVLHNGAFVKKIHDSEARAGVGGGPFPAKFPIFPARYYIFGTVIHEEVDKIQIFRVDQTDAFRLLISERSHNLEEGEEKGQQLEKKP
jgi:hypothetical protein